MISYPPDILTVGSPAPDFSLPSLDGSTLSLGSFIGQPVLLSFGASWCPDCRSAARLLPALQQQCPGLAILFVDRQEPRDVVRRYAERFRMQHPVLLDSDGEIARLYGVVAIPTDFFIDSDGVIRGVLIEHITPELLASKLALIGLIPQPTA